MKTSASKFCYCSSGKIYEDCCKPLHDGAPPKNALELMRSRFSAYVLNLSDYIIATTHPASPEYTENIFTWKSSISDFSKAYSFNKLEILDFKEVDKLSTVTFTAHITQGNKDCTFTEKSIFEELQGKWLYRVGTLAQGHEPNLITTGQLRLLPVAYYGDPVLTKKAEPVTEITKEIKKITEEMVETMDACNGMGLAAPQVHHLIRLFVIRPLIKTNDGNYLLGEAEVFINPKIISLSEETWKAPEGCLSIPTIREEVERPTEITVEYTDLQGTTKTECFSEWHAREILHENDHLDGILFINRVKEDKYKAIEPSLKNLEKRIHDGT